MAQISILIGEAFTKIFQSLKNYAAPTSSSKIIATVKTILHIVKIKNIRTIKTIAVIILKAEQCGLTIQ